MLGLEITLESDICCEFVLVLGLLKINVRVRDRAKDKAKDGRRMLTANNCNERRPALLMRNAFRDETRIASVTVFVHTPVS
jgi:hypothetical protein